MSRKQKNNVRTEAAKVVSVVMRQRGSLDTLLAEATKRIEQSEYGFLQEICYGTLRHFFSLQAHINQYLKKPLKDKDSDVLALLLTGAYQLSYMRVPDYAAINESVSAAVLLNKPWAKGLVNAVLRKVKDAQEPQLKPADKADHPLWLYKKIRAAWPDEAESIFAANNLKAPMTLRVNLSRLSREKYLEQLQRVEIDAEKTAFSEAGIQLCEAVDVERLPGFSEGDVSVQDEAAQLVAPLLELEPGLSVLDACAAPGGKTCHMLESVTELKVTALDCEEHRLQQLEENLQRLGVSAKTACVDAAQPQLWWEAINTGEQFDRILLDAPCSASGVIRRHPDIKLLRRETDIVALVETQTMLLEALWPLLKPGGKLLYTTCSILPEENEEVVASFLAKADDAMVSALDVEWNQTVSKVTKTAQPEKSAQSGCQLLPQQNGYDGFYFARLIKTAPPGKADSI